MQYRREVLEDDRQYHAGVLRNSDYIHCSDNVFSGDGWSTDVADEGGVSGDREDAGVRSCAAETAIAAAGRQVNRNYLFYPVEAMAALWRMLAVLVSHRFCCSGDFDSLRICSGNRRPATTWNWILCILKLSIMISECTVRIMPT